MSTVKQFYLHLAQTSAAPLGLQIVDAEGIYLYDVKGRAILDAISGICVSAVGHKHPRVVSAVVDQATRYQHVMVYGECVLTPQTNLAVALSSTLPSSLSVSYFTNSGSEATEGALKLAKRYTGRSDFVAFEKGYHGSSCGALSIVGHEGWRRAYRPLLPGVTHIPFGEKEALSAINQRTAAVIIEPIQGEAGVRIPTVDYLQAVAARCQSYWSIAYFGRSTDRLGKNRLLLGDGALWLTA